MKIGDFLLRRLEEAGVRHLFGVPGDYNLALLQQLHDTGTLKWIGTCNELNASYAADGYARLNGLGALTVTNGVGPLSAINGIGGSCSEHVPVICISGSIPLRSIERGLGMHHTMADGSYDHFLRAYAQVTAAQARLTPRDAATEIDRLILTAWREKLPVYMELPSDIAYLDIEVPADPLILAEPPATRNGYIPASRRLRGDCPPPSRRRSWWMRTPAGSALHPNLWSWPKRCRLQWQRSTQPRP
jgi:indolepyruvate decarboxylase